MSEWRKCSLHPEVDPRRMWGCPDCVVQLRRDLAECERSASGLRRALVHQAHELASARRRAGHYAAHATLAQVQLNAIPRWVLWCLGAWRTLRQAPLVFRWSTWKGKSWWNF